MKFSILTGLVSVFDAIHGIACFHHQDEQLENHLMEVRHLYHNMATHHSTKLHQGHILYIIS